jgi:hypothetical protein
MDTPPLTRGVTTSSERGLGLGMRVRCEDGIVPCLPAFPSSRPSHLGCAHRLTTHFLPTLVGLALSRSLAPRSWSWAVALRTGHGIEVGMALGHRTECP